MTFKVIFKHISIIVQFTLKPIKNFFTYRHNKKILFLQQQIKDYHNISNLNTPPIDKVASYSLNIEILFIVERRNPLIKRHILIYKKTNKKKKDINILEHMAHINIFQRVGVD